MEITDISIITKHFAIESEPDSCRAYTRYQGKERNESTNQSFRFRFSGHILSWIGPGTWLGSLKAASTRLAF